MLYVIDIGHDIREVEAACSNFFYGFGSNFWLGCTFEYEVFDCFWGRYVELKFLAGWTGVGFGFFYCVKVLV